jgi:hypothetical protein
MLETQIITLSGRGMENRTASSHLFLVFSAFLANLLKTNFCIKSAIRAKKITKKSLKNISVLFGDEVLKF